MNAKHLTQTIDSQVDSYRDAFTLGGQQALLAEDCVERRRRKAPGLALATLTVIWIGVVGIGLSWIWAYEATPGEATKSPASWPADSRIDRSANLPTIVMFAHPRCPCTRASIRELALIMARCPGRVEARVLFYKPRDFSSEWEKADLWFSAEAIPGVKVVSDEDGSETKRFHATTSGHALLYNSRGELLFSGGITGSRGHSGDNVGRSAIESFLINGAEDQKQTFVFGCPLLGQDDAGDTECQE